MKKYFQLLVEGFVLGMRNPKGDKEPEILAPGIMPVGKFIIHPKTNKIMLADPAFPDALHTSIALNYGFDNVSDAQSKGWVRGSYIKPNRMGGNGLLKLEGYHGHEDLRKLLSRLSGVIPNNVDFMVDNYDREEGGEMDSKNFTGTEALNQYIQGGGINPIVVPTSTSTPTDYPVEKELRKTVPEWQRAFESFTFSKLRTQLNEEHKELLVEEKLESFVASGMKRHPEYQSDETQPPQSRAAAVIRDRVQGPRNKRLSEFEDFLRNIHPHVNGKHEKDFVINNHVQVNNKKREWDGPYVGHHGTEDIEQLKQMLKHQRILVKRGISKPEDIGTNTLAEISALHDEHEDILIPIKRATSAQGLAPYKIGRIEHPTKEGEHLDVHLARNITDDKEADTIAKNVKTACPAGSTICIQHKGEYVKDYSRGHGLLVFTNPKSGDVEFAHGLNDGFRTHKNDRVEKDVYDKIVNNIFKLNSPKMTPYLLEHGSADQVHPLISKMLSQNNVNDLTEDDQRSVVIKGNHNHITELLKRQKLSGQVQDLIRDKGNDSHRNALSERPDRISLDNPSSHEYIANHRSDDQLEKLLDHPQLDPNLISTIHKRIETPRIQFKLLKGDTIDSFSRERYEVNILKTLHENLRKTRNSDGFGPADIHHNNLIDQFLDLPSITEGGQLHMSRQGMSTPQQLARLMSRPDFAQGVHRLVAEHGNDWHRTQLLKRADFSVNAHRAMVRNGNYEHIAELLKRPDLDINIHNMIATNDWNVQSDGDLQKYQRNLITLINRQDLNPNAHNAIAKYGNDAAHAALLNRPDISRTAVELIQTHFGNNVNRDRARVIAGYQKQTRAAMQATKDNSSIKESWQEYDAKVGETNTSLFEPGNTKFNMKAFLKKLRKKNGVGVNLPGEN